MPNQKKFTEKELDFLRDNFESMSVRELAGALGRSVSGVRKRARKLGFRKNTRFVWTDDRLQILREMYPTSSNKEIAAKLETNLKKLTPMGIYKKASSLGLKKDSEYLRQLNRRLGEKLGESGRGYRFKKGHSPWTKGKKIPIRSQSKATQFKKGHSPHNICQIGDLRKPDKEYWKIKIAEPNKWEFLHIYIWTQNHGKPPKGMCVAFKDGNKENCTIENLELLSKKEIMLRNTIHNLPPEIVEVKYILGRLTQEINKQKDGKYAKKK